MLRKMVLTLIMPVLLFLFTLCAVESRAETSSSATVGMSAVLEDVILSGSELKIKEIQEETPVILRVIEVKPHGPDMFRYKFEYYGLKPGDYNLVDYLERIDRSEIGELPAVTVQVQSILAADRVEPNQPQTSEIPGIGGYQFWLRAGAVLWVAGIVLILLLTRKRPEDDLEGDDTHVPSLAERLQPMVEQAISGKLNQTKMAELELMLVAFWRRKLHLEEADIASVTQQLKQHEEAGPLLLELESLLHRPQTNHEVNVAQMLEPYQNLPAEELEEELAELAS